METISYEDVNSLLEAGRELVTAGEASMLLGLKNPGSFNELRRRDENAPAPKFQCRSANGSLFFLYDRADVLAYGDVSGRWTKKAQGVPEAPATGFDHAAALRFITGKNNPDTSCYGVGRYEFSR